MRERVVIAMSGGVDSSVAAALLVDAAYEVVGVWLRLWQFVDGAATEGSDAPPGLHDARAVAEQLGIALEEVDVMAQFRSLVVDEFVDEYRCGRTPNPCARCNPLVKFDALRERARALGATRIATGHYARLRRGPHGIELLRAADASRDQSYFLFAVRQDVLEHAVFPVGDLSKAAVREEARRRGLPVAEKQDSQEICFLPQGECGDFVAASSSTVPLRPGEIVDARGRVLGRHQGVHRFTIGQRRGLGIGGGGPPRYVTAIDAHAGVVRVGDASEVISDGLVARGANWLGDPPRSGEQLMLKIRARFVPQPAVVAWSDGDGFGVTAPGRLSAVTAGQAAVLYDGDRVVGGGWIERAVKSAAALWQDPC